LDIAKTIGIKIQIVRKSKGIAQEHLAFSSGLDRSYIGKIERGEFNITVKKLYAICKALECEFTDILPTLGNDKQATLDVVTKGSTGK
jgi:transcriptional regulator with XRE-family HTH domain